MKLKNQQISRKYYNKDVCVKVYNKIHTHTHTQQWISVLVIIDIKFWYKIINNFSINVCMLLFLLLKNCWKLYAIIIWLNLALSWCKKYVLS